MSDMEMPDFVKSGKTGVLGGNAPAKATNKRRSIFTKWIYKGYACYENVQAYFDCMDRKILTPLPSFG